MKMSADLRPSGELKLRVIPPARGFPSPTMRHNERGRTILSEVCRMGLPQLGLAPEVNRWRANNFPNWLRGFRLVRRSLKTPGPSFVGALYLAHISDGFGRRELGLAGCRVVTDAWVNEIVDRLIAAGNINNFNFHGIGTGAAAEAAGDTALGTEITTEYATDNTRPTGTQVEGATANIYRTVGTITVDAAVAATEHGIFNQAATGGGILLDRTVFTVVNLANGDSLQATYELTINSGG